MFQIKVAKKIHILCWIALFGYHALYEVMSKNMVESKRPQMAIWRRVECWISKTKRAHASALVDAPGPARILTQRSTVDPLITDTSNKERKSYSPNRLHTVPDKSLELQLTYTSYNEQNLNSPAVSVIRGSTYITIIAFPWQQWLTRTRMNVTLFVHWLCCIQGNRIWHKNLWRRD